MTEKTKSLALSLRDCLRELPFGLNKLYDEIRSGRLIARKCGRRSIVLRSDLESYLRNLPPVDLDEGRFRPQCTNHNPPKRRKNAEVRRQHEAAHG